MWPLAIFLMLVVAFYWGAFYLTVAAWLNAIGHLFRGPFHPRQHLVQHWVWNVVLVAGLRRNS